MSKVFRANRKASDEDIIRLNKVGLSLSAIGKELGCHPSTITLRLQALGIEPADTRHTFMGDIYHGLTETQRSWLEDQIGPHASIKDFIRNMLVKEFIAHKPSETTSHVH